MNYQESLNGLWDTLVTTAVTGVNYYETKQEAIDENVDLALVNAQNTAVARNQAQQSVWDANKARFQAAIDSDKAKRYIIIGGAIGVPLIVLLLARRKKKG